MPYNRATIDKADSDPVNCGTCAYKNDCPAKRSYTECTRESGYPLWASSRLKSNWVKKRKTAPERQFGKRQKQIFTVVFYHNRKEKSI